MGNNILSTKEKLFHKGIVHDSSFPFCLNQVETMFHALWSCPAAVAVWQDCCRRLQKMTLGEGDGLYIIKLLKERLDQEEFIEAVMVLRQQVWLRRNEFVFKGNFIPPGQIISRAQDMIKGFSEASQGDVLMPVAVVSNPPKWRLPVDGWLKANWDAALNKTSRNMSVGVVVRNDQGQVVAALAKVFPYIDDPTIAEAVATWQAVNLCVGRGLHHVVLEGDSKNVVTALIQTQPNWSSHG